MGIENIVAYVNGALKSWTVRFNTAMLAVVGALPMMQDSLPALQPYIPSGFYRYLMGTVVVCNLLLRFKTNKPLRDR